MDFIKNWLKTLALVIISLIGIAFFMIILPEYILIPLLGLTGLGADIFQMAFILILLTTMIALGQQTS